MNLGNDLDALTTEKSKPSIGMWVSLVYKELEDLNKCVDDLLGKFASLDKQIAVDTNRIFGERGISETLKELQTDLNKYRARYSELLIWLEQNKEVIKTTIDKVEHKLGESQHTLRESEVVVEGIKADIVAHKNDNDNKFKELDKSTVASKYVSGWIRSLFDKFGYIFGAAVIAAFFIGFWMVVKIAFFREMPQWLRELLQSVAR
jgi:predicted  nucleic acid-binding Zn-ribbon protein